MVLVTFLLANFILVLKNVLRKVALLPVIIFIKTCLSPVKYLKTNP